jgi:hypothetical protein
VQGQKKILLRGTDDVLVVGLHMVGKRLKVSSLNNVTSFLALYFSFTLISFLPLLFSHSLLFLSFSHSHIFFFVFTFLYIIFSFFSIPYSYFSLYFCLS